MKRTRTYQFRLCQQQCEPHYLGSERTTNKRVSNELAIWLVLARDGVMTAQAFLLAASPWMLQVTKTGMGCRSKSQIGS